MQSFAGACVIVLLAGLASCGSFGAADAPDGGSTDSGPSASLDASGSEGSSSDGGRFCDPSVSAKFCEDFDDTTDMAPPFAFEMQEVTGAGTLAIASDVVSSAPRSLVATLGDGGLAWLEKTVLGPLPTRLSIAFAFRILAFEAASTASGHFLDVRCASTDAQEIFFKIEGAALGLGVRQNPGSLDVSAPAGFTKGNWAKVRVVFDRSATSTYQVTVRVDGTKVADAPSDALGQCLQGGLSVRLGARPSDPKSTTAHFSFGFDDVLIDWN